MKFILKIVIVVCLLKVVVCIWRVNLKAEIAEFKLFYDRELFRKYLDHEMTIHSVSSISREFEEISKDSINHFLKFNKSDDWRKDTQRQTFQDYIKYLKSVYPSDSHTYKISLNSYPPILQNTVAEENAKQEIFSLFEQMSEHRIKFDNGQVKGMIKEITNNDDSLNLTIIPFSYRSQLEFHTCMCGMDSLAVEKNPFWYTGPLNNCQCHFLHPHTKESSSHALHVY